MFVSGKFHLITVNDLCLSMLKFLFPIYTDVFNSFVLSYETRKLFQNYLIIH